MSIALLITGRKLDALKNALEQKLPGVLIQCWPELPQPEDVTFAVAWQQPENIWAQLPNLRAVSSYGAGCDGLIMDDNLPATIDICRIVDPHLAQLMSEYVLATILSYRCRLWLFTAQQTKANWRPKGRHKGNRVVILGVGQIGTVVANRLLSNGFEVTGWSRTKKHKDFHCFAGDSELALALADADYVVNLLPNTPATKGLVNQRLFSYLPNSAVLINVGRGDTLNEQDLIVALEQQQLQAAILDVFSQEPLAEDHPFWYHPHIHITPHIAAVTDVATVVEQLAENYLNVTHGKPLMHQVDKDLGY